MASVVVDFVVVTVECTTSSSTVVAIEVSVAAACVDVFTMVCTCYKSSVCLPGKGILLILFSG